MWNIKKQKLIVSMKTLKTTTSFHFINSHLKIYLKGKIVKHRWIYTCLLHIVNNIKNGNLLSDELIK